LIRRKSNQSDSKYLYQIIKSCFVVSAENQAQRAGQGAGCAGLKARGKEKGERRKEKGERRKEKGERRKEKGERRKENGEWRKEKVKTRK